MIDKKSPREWSIHLRKKANRISSLGGMIGGALLGIEEVGQ